jgi:U3 small nucleolar ribonucleoprotein protein IMP4
LFVPAKADSKRVITFSNENDTISFRNHSYYKEDYKTVALNELGPRFEMKPY